CREHHEPVREGEELHLEDQAGEQPEVEDGEHVVPREDADETYEKPHGPRMCARDDRADGVTADVARLVEPNLPAVEPDPEARDPGRIPGADDGVLLLELLGDGVAPFLQG